MRRLAQELGTGPASLYAHVAGKDELLALLIDRVAGEIELARARPRALAGAAQGVRARDAARARRAPRPRRRGAGQHPHRRRTPSARSTRMLGILRAGGLPDQVDRLAADLLPQLVAVDDLRGSLFERADAARAGATSSGSAPTSRRCPPRASRTSRRSRGAMIAEDEEHDARFEFGLAVLVRGLAAVAAR